jgi:hypothetical protein
MNPNDHPTMITLIGQVRKIWDDHYAANRRKFGEPEEEECYFHLTPCYRCSAPSWQEPCPWCHFYHMGRADANEAEQNREKNRLPFERFKSAVDTHGNFAALYFRCHHNPKQSAIDAAAALTDCPTPEQIWEAVTGLNPEQPRSVYPIPVDQREALLKQRLEDDNF